MGVSPSTPRQDGLPALPESAWVRVVGAMRHLEAHGLRHEGIYRVSGLGRDVQRAAEWLATGAGDLSYSSLPVNEWAGAVKACLHRFEPLSSYRLYDFLRACAQAVAADRARSLAHVLSVLPRRNLVRLRYACGHLCRIAAASDVNLMTASNLAKLWGGILARPNEAPATNLGAELRLAHEQFLIGTMLLAHFGAPERSTGGTVDDEPWTADEEGGSGRGGGADDAVPSILIPPAPTRQRSEPLLGQSPPTHATLERPPAAAAAAAAGSPPPSSRRMLPSYSSLRFSWRPPGLARDKAGGGGDGGSLARAAAATQGSASRRGIRAKGADPDSGVAAPPSAGSSSAGAAAAAAPGSSRTHVGAARFPASPVPPAAPAPAPAAEERWGRGRPSDDDEEEEDAEGAEGSAGGAAFVGGGAPPALRQSTGPVRHLRGGGGGGPPPAGAAVDDAAASAAPVAAPRATLAAASAAAAADSLLPPPPGGGGVQPPRRQAIQGGRHFTAIAPAGPGSLQPLAAATAAEEEEGGGEAATQGGAATKQSRWRRMLTWAAHAPAAAPATPRKAPTTPR